MVLGMPLAIIPWSLGEIVDGSSELDANAHASDNGESDGSSRTYQQQQDNDSILIYVLVAISSYRECYSGSGTGNHN